MPDENKKFLGKKVFFLYPHSVMHNELIMELLKSEYEVYILKDHKKALKIFEKYNDAILFVNIDTELKEHEWEEYIINIMNNPMTKDVRIGILSYNDDNSLVEKFLMQIGVPCGFIKLKIGFEESKKIILKALEANEARGLRKYVRAEFADNSSSIATLNLKIDGTLYNGWIKDISAAGFAFILNNAKGLSISVNTLLSDIQLRLRGQICMVSGIVAGVRQDDKDNMYVVMFDKNMKQPEKDKIHNFIYISLQHMLDMEINEVKTQEQQKKPEATDANAEKKESKNKPIDKDKEQKKDPKEKPKGK
jgi:hypothetical protein